MEKARIQSFLSVANNKLSKIRERQPFRHFADPFLNSLFQFSLKNPRALTFKRQPHKMFKHTQAIFRLTSTNCMNVFDHFVGLLLKMLKDCIWRLNHLYEVNPFLANVPILYPLKTPENLVFSRGIK